MNEENLNPSEDSGQIKKSFVDRLIEKTKPSVGKTTLNIPIGTESILVEPLQIINANNFFLDDSTGGFITKSAFIAHVLSMNKNQLTAFNALFDQMTAGVKIDSPPFEISDSKARKYMWISSQHLNGNSSFKVLTAGRLCSLVGIYQFGIFKCELSLEALYTKAINSKQPVNTKH